jgi:NDP-sugar pyrophosphorylase family protein
MKVVMPIAGLGSRFSKIGITTPKPLILVKNKRMIEWALKSIPFAKSEDYIFIIRKEQVEQFQLDKELKYLLGNNIKIIVIDEVTDGAARTVLKVKELINNDEPLIITDCDHFFINTEYTEKIKDTNITGIIPVFKTNRDPKWSFTKFNEDGKVSDVKEKVPISDYANIGAYFFRHGKDFVWAAEKMIEKNLKVNGEFYVAPVYRQLLERGDNIHATICDTVFGLGTPNDVYLFEEKYND